VTGILVTRPEPGASETAAQLVRLGHQPMICPLLEIVYLDAPIAIGPDMAALVVTSPSGVRALARLTGRRDLRLYSVGDRTADLAHQLGFSDILSAAGDVHALADLIVREPPVGPGRLLHVCGEDVAGDLAGLLRPHGIGLDRHIAYQAVPVQALDGQTMAALADGRISHVLLFSARTARCFVNLVEKARLAPVMMGLTALCISQTVAGAAQGLAWGGIKVAASPDADHLLALLPPGTGA
jgi:uroporphyrinogen-III synthase